VAEKNRLIAGLEERILQAQARQQSQTATQESEKRLVASDLTHRIRILEIENAGLREQVSSSYVMEKENKSLRQIITELQVCCVFDNSVSV
jgi:hypothetical protein